MNKEIISYFKTNRSFDAGVKLYNKYGLSKSFKIALNRQGYSKYNEDLLHEELRKVAGLTDQQLKSILAVPVRKTVEPKAAAPKEKKKYTVDELFADFNNIDIDELDYFDALALCEKLNITFKRSMPAKDDVFTALKAEQAPQPVEKISDIPAQIKKTIRLREEFPFLKTPECPNELKILVADMLTAYETYKTDHEKLFDAATQEDIQELSKSVVENYIENKLIWKELNHFKKHGKVLGEHPVFSWMKRLEQIRSMNNSELIKLREQLKNKIHRTKKLIKDNPEHAETGKREKRQQSFERELKEVERLLGLNER